MPDAGIRQREGGWVVALTLVLVGLVNLPYLLAYAVPTPWVFGGILFNPLDGYSYLAKLREGWRGEWLFTLPYTAEPGAGAFIFSYHLGLGHLARWLGVSLEWVYHLARVLSSLFFLLTAYHFITRFVDSFRWRLAAWLMFCLGSGLGWLATPLGEITSDFWVAEAFPFLTVFSNAHFPLTWAGLLWLFEWTLPGLAPPPTFKRLALIALGVTLQAQVQPMVLLTLGLILGGMVAGRWLTTRTFARDEWVTLLVVGLAAGPWILNALWVTRANPVLAAWNAQNLTPTPVWWDVLLSGGVPLVLALVGLFIASRRRGPLDQVLIYWFVLGTLSLYAPFDLQRRLALGLWMPVTLLAILALRTALLPRLRPAWRPLALTALVLPMLFTNALVYVSVVAAVQMRDPALFLTPDEDAALAWLAGRARGNVVLASPEIALRLPARTDARVIYGHPFETVEAETRRMAVEDYFAGRTSLGDFSARYAVDYIFYGPREKLLGVPDLTAWRAVFQQGDVTIYAP